MQRILAFALLCGLLLATIGATIPPPWIPTSLYHRTQIRGWTVLVSPNLMAERELSVEVLDLLDNHLFQAARVIPEPALSKLREVEIWAELEMSKTACMCYHVSRDWLIPNGYNGDKEQSVEIGNARNFLTWTKGQPSMVLHELAHAYHDRVLGFEHAEVKGAHEAMLASGVYEEVMHIHGEPRRHYALKNHHEYFAETTEALFGTNDFYPFVRNELRQADPRGYEMVLRLWRGTEG